jgi:hypothetical protein
MVYNAEIIIYMKRWNNREHLKAKDGTELQTYTPE